MSQGFHEQGSWWIVMRVEVILPELFFWNHKKKVCFGIYVREFGVSKAWKCDLGWGPTYLPSKAMAGVGSGSFSLMALPVAPTRSLYHCSRDWRSMLSCPLRRKISC